MKITRVIITAGGKGQRSLPLQALIKGAYFGLHGLENKQLDVFAK